MTEKGEEEVIQLLKNVKAVERYLQSILKAAETKTSWACPLGSFGLNGIWSPNPHLKMTAEEQREHNIRHGFLK
jgi:hypothetical protein